jgi:hypothetical protein
MKRRCFFVGLVGAGAAAYRAVTQLELRPGDYIGIMEGISGLLGQLATGIARASGYTVVGIASREPGNIENTPKARTLHRFIFEGLPQWSKRKAPNSNQISAYSHARS